MSTQNDKFDETFVKFVDQIGSLPDLESDEASKAMRNLHTFSQCRPPKPDPEPEPTPEPIVLNRWERFKVGASCVWNSETTQVLVKTAGTFGGVALVVWSTIHRDHVLERQSLAQANQRPS